MITSWRGFQVMAAPVTDHVSLGVFCGRKPIAPVVSMWACAAFMLLRMLIATVIMLVFITFGEGKS